MTACRTFGIPETTLCNAIIVIRSVEKASPIQPSTFNSTPINAVTLYVNFTARSPAIGPRKSRYIIVQLASNDHNQGVVDTKPIIQSCHSLY